MQLDELHTLITENPAEAWTVIKGGPAFRSDAAEAEHPVRAVLKFDLEVALEWGLRADNGNRATFDEYDWAEIAFFKDPTVAEVWVDVRLHGELVERVKLLLVDGGRAYLPFPEKLGGTWITRKWERSLASLVSGLDGRWGAHGSWGSHYLGQMRADHDTY
ncbi:hypothetical protein I8920_03950 [Curtobacterium sp. YC1]|uniref:hypothetical protein n=1 Tax=Curtobacterium sp. YC1 TaxID=2795488 RepID=UPI0018E52B82|nr:hypothetical protein [Curtobacterium sp. YC1]QQD76921.1 hypothetical protein I8920_03950 [Curtobacterium sp. YC1]